MESDAAHTRVPTAVPGYHRPSRRANPVLCRFSVVEGATDCPLRRCPFVPAIARAVEPEGGAAREPLGGGLGLGGAVVVWAAACLGMDDGDGEGRAGGGGGAVPAGGGVDAAPFLVVGTLACARCRARRRVRLEPVPAGDGLNEACPGGAEGVPPRACWSSLKAAEADSRAAWRPVPKRNAACSAGPHSLGNARLAEAVANAALSDPAAEATERQAASAAFHAAGSRPRPRGA